MLNHSRRAPPPAPLIRLFNPNGEERQSRVDQSSDNSSPPESPSSGSVSDSSETYEVYHIGQDHDSIPSDSGKPCFEMQMRWLRGSSSSSKHDSLPTSVSSISSPRSALSASWPNEDRIEEEEDISSLHDLQCREEKARDDTKPVVDWLAHLADSSFKTDGEVLLFFQSDQDPGKNVRFDC